MSSENHSFGIFPLTPPLDIPAEPDTSPTFNDSVNNVTMSPSKDPLITLTVPAIMFASGVLGNVLAIFVLVRSSRDHKQTVFYRLVGALAATDLFGTCATSPVTLAVYANNLQWVGGQHLCNYEAFIFVFVSCTTICIIGTMAMDRVFAISFPFFYERNLTYYRAKFFIIGIWGFSALLGCLPFVGLGEVVNQFPGTWCFFTFTSDKLKNKIYAYGYAGIGLFIIVLTGIANVIVTAILLKMRRKALRSMRNRKRNDCELQMMVLLLGIIIVFATCWCPFLIRILINQVAERQVDVRADLHALRLASLNQILDPWVYILFRREFFKKAAAFFRDNCKCFFAIPSRANATFRSEAVNHVSAANDVSAHAPSASSQYAPLENEDKDVEDNNCCFENGPVMEMNGMNGLDKSSSFQSDNNAKSKSNSNLFQESDLTKQCHSNCDIDCKHSACLFCFSKRPQNVSNNCVTETKSLGRLDFAILECDAQHFLVNVKIRAPNQLNVDGPGKRESFHLSLGDMRCS